MSTSVVLPALGESVTEGTVTRWLKKVGDTVEADEGLLEISTDKVDTEIPSPVGGVIEEILVQEDETVEVGAILAKIGDGSGAAAAPAQDAPAEAPAAEAPPPKHPLRSRGARPPRLPPPRLRPPRLPLPRRPPPRHPRPRRPRSLPPRRAARMSCSPSSARASPRAPSRAG